MTTLTGKTIANTYKDLLQVSNSNAGVDATLRSVEDGEGTSSALQVSTTNAAVQGDFSVSGQITVGGEVIAIDQRVSTSDALITENFGEVGAGVTNVYSGIEIDRGSANPYRFQFNETSDDFRIGEFYVTLTYGTLAGGTFTFNNKLVGGTSGAIGYIITDNGSTTATIKSVVGTFQNGETITEYNRSTGVTTGVTASLTAGPAITDNTQAVATRQDSPTNNAVAFWDNASLKFNTDPNLTFNSNRLTVNSAVISGGTNTFNITNGSASFDVASGSTVDINSNLTVESASVLNQDLTTDANVQFAQANLIQTSAGSKIASSYFLNTSTSNSSQMASYFGAGTSGGIGTSSIVSEYFAGADASGDLVQGFNAFKGSNLSTWMSSTYNGSVSRTIMYGNFGIGTTDWAGATNAAFAMADSAAPTGTPTGGGVLYVESGALKYKGSSGTVTTVAVA